MTVLPDRASFAHSDFVSGFCSSPRIHGDYGLMASTESDPFFNQLVPVGEDSPS